MTDELISLCCLGVLFLIADSQLILHISQSLPLNLVLFKFLSKAFWCFDPNLWLDLWPNTTTAFYPTSLLSVISPGNKSYFFPYLFILFSWKILLLQLLSHFSWPRVAVTLCHLSALLILELFEISLLIFEVGLDLLPSSPPSVSLNFPAFSASSPSPISHPPQTLFSS